MNKVKELHLWLDFEGISAEDYNICITTVDTINHMKSGDKVLHTVIPHYLQWIYAERLFVHYKGICHELTLGECEGTAKDIREVHNMERLVLNKAFDWAEDL